jgi:hypothetical protein
MTDSLPFDGAWSDADAGIQAMISPSGDGLLIPGHDGTQTARAGIWNDPQDGLWSGLGTIPTGSPHDVTPLSHLPDPSTFLGYPGAVAAHVADTTPPIDPASPPHGAPSHAATTLDREAATVQLFAGAHDVGLAWDNKPDSVDDEGLTLPGEVQVNGFDVTIDSDAALRNIHVSNPFGDGMFELDLDPSTGPDQTSGLAPTPTGVLAAPDTCIPQPGPELSRLIDAIISDAHHGVGEQLTPGAREPLNYPGSAGYVGPLHPGDLHLNQDNPIPLPHQPSGVNKNSDGHDIRGRLSPNAADGLIHPKLTMPLALDHRPQFDTADLRHPVQLEHPEAFSDLRDANVVHIPLDTLPSRDEVVRSWEVGPYWHAEETRDGDLYLEETTIDGDRTGRYVHLSADDQGSWMVTAARGDKTIDAVAVARVTAVHTDGTFDCSYLRIFTSDPAANLEP